MFQRRSLKWPITLGVVLIVLLVLITVGWILLATFGNQWVLLAIGASMLIIVLVGVVMYLVLTIKEINLNRRQSNFMDSITHELKSPMASLKLYLQTLTLREVDKAEQDRFHHFMLEDVERLDGLINHLLIAARLERGKTQETEEEVQLASLLEQCATSICLRYRVPHDTVRVEATPCIVRGRPVDVDVIFRNLIDNAVKYAGETPEVLVHLEPIADKVRVRISDNGRGVPVKMRRRIFGRFVRLGIELQRETPGTGLGLHIVATLVRRMKGSIRVSDAKPTGAVFEVTLPRAVETEPESSVD